MITMTLSELATILHIEKLTHDAEFTGVSTDTRKIVPQNLFIAIEGENFNGHDFVNEAFKKGACAAIVSKKVDSAIPQLIVKNTIDALGHISAAWRDRFKIPLVGVTGSNGKTTLKNMIASILRAECGNATDVLATEGNLNNYIGVPIMLCQLNANHRYGVLEMGMNHSGEIHYLTHLVKPKVAIVNNAAAAHLEALLDVKGVAHAKGEIFSGLNDDGIAILNRDDDYYELWHQMIDNHQHYSFSMQHTADITAKLHNLTALNIQTPKGNIVVNLPLLGRHNMMNALAATAATIALGVSLDAIKQGLETIQAAPGRLRQHMLSDTVRLIDDTYNANPASVSAAINTLATMDGTKILILGDMKELGSNAKQLHFDIGQKALDAGIEYLFTFGELSSAATQAFGNNALHFTDKEELVLMLKKQIHDKTSVLVKGSRSMRMEQVVQALLPQNQNKIENTH